MDYEERRARIERCQRFIEIEGTEWSEFYAPLLHAAEHGNGGGFDEEAEALVRIVENACDRMVWDGHYIDYYEDEGGPERIREWITYRKDNPPQAVVDPELLSHYDAVGREVIKDEYWPQEKVKRNVM